MSWKYEELAYQIGHIKLFLVHFWFSLVAISFCFQRVYDDEIAVEDAAAKVKDSTAKQVAVLIECYLRSVGFHVFFLCIKLCILI